MSPVEYTWRDSELRSPPLRVLNGMGARLARLGIDLPSLVPSSVESAAAKEARSDDFGGDSYRQPLEVFLDACAQEADLTTFGRILITKMLSGALANRIALHRWALAHPDVRGERINSPWVIVGLPRTGTSLLSLLLGLDPMSRPLHPFGATLAQECVSLFMYDIRTLALETQAHVPSYARWLEQADMAPAYAQHRLALQTLQSRQPTERWVLKTPNHLWHLEALLAAYPDARIIWTHRNPGPVVTSLASLANAGQRPLTWRSDPRPTAEEWKRKCVFALNSAVAFDTTSEEGWCQHLHYDLLMADPVGTVGNLYRSFGEEVSDLHARRMEAFLLHRPKDAFGRHRYDPADFGWTYAGLADEFHSYIDRYQIATGPES